MWKSIIIKDQKKSLFTNVRTVRVHKPQFNVIQQNAEYVKIECIEDGRSITFKKEPEDKDVRCMECQNATTDEFGIIQCAYNDMCDVSDPEKEKSTFERPLFEKKYKEE